jgi:hypothetical protein
MTDKPKTIEELFAEAGLKVTTIDLTTPEQREQEERARTMPVPPDASPLVDELVEMVTNDPNSGTEYESAFLGKDTRQRTREIGTSLYAVGGHDLMLCAYYRVRSIHGAGSSRALEMAWDGIGQWWD